MAISKELSDGIAAYKRTWQRFDGLVVAAQVGVASAQRKVGVFDAGECQPTITTTDGQRYLVRDLDSLRVAGASGVGESTTVTDYKKQLAARMLAGAKSAVATCEDQSLSARHSHLVGWMLGEIDESDRLEVGRILHGRVSPLPCPRCGSIVKAEFNGIGNTIVCRGCYAWTPDEGHESEIAIELTEADAIADWNDQVESYLDTEAHERQNANARRGEQAGVQGDGSQAAATCGRTKGDSRETNVSEKKVVDKQMDHRIEE